MRAKQETLTVATAGRGFHDVTRDVRRVVDASGVVTGLCVVFVQHTSASLILQENADPAVLRDLQAWLSAAAPEGAGYEHDDEGPDDMPAHLRTVMMRTSESIPVTSGKLALGTWQAIYVVEHRRAAHRRHVVVHVMGD